MAIVRVRPPGTNYVTGDPIAGEPSRVTLTGAFTAPGSTSDINDRAREGVTESRTLYDPSNTEVLHTDQVEVDGVLFEVDGVPAPWENPFTGWKPGTVTALVRAVG